MVLLKREQREQAGRSSGCNTRLLERIVLFATMCVLLAHVNMPSIQPAVDSSSTEKNQLLCDQKLDELDKVFDQKTQVRQENMRIDTVVYWDMYEPEAHCISEERFGSESTIRYNAFGDGPKFMCGVDTLAKKENCLVYSVGSYNKIAFERAVHTFLGCETHTFDPTLNGPFVGDEYATFHPWGLGIDGRKNSFDGHTFVSKSFETIFRDLGHLGKKIDVIKIDCEGCEWTTLPPLFDLIMNGRVQVDQILVEMHDNNRSNQNITKFFEMADKANMRITHKERNHWAPQARTCVEYAMVSKSFLREANMNSICP